MSSLFTNFAYHFRNCFSCSLFLAGTLNVFRHSLKSFVNVIKGKLTSHLLRNLLFHTKKALLMESLMLTLARVFPCIWYVYKAASSFLGTPFNVDNRQRPLPWGM